MTNSLLACGGCTLIECVQVKPIITKLDRVSCESQYGWQIFDTWFNQKSTFWPIGLHQDCVCRWYIHWSYLYKHSYKGVGSGIQYRHLHFKNSNNINGTTVNKFLGVGMQSPVIIIIRRYCADEPWLIYFTAPDYDDWTACPHLKTN